MGHLPSIGHTVAVGVGVVDERTVLGLFKCVGKPVSVRIECIDGFRALSKNVLFGGTLEISNAFIGLPESTDSNEQRAENERRDDGDVRHLVVIHGHG